MMKVSVIIPCYNAREWVGEALRSVVAQTEPAHEIIVIDDGSTDDTLARVAATGIAARLLHTRRANAAGARNAGIDAATGDWIAFLDADDYWYPYHLAAARHRLEGTDDVACLNHCDLLDHESGQVRSVRPYGVREQVSGLSDEDFVRLWSQRSHFPNGGVVARRDVVQRVGGFDVTQVRRHDFELFLRIVQGRTWSYNVSPTWRYRHGTPAAISRSTVSCAYFSLRAVLKHRSEYQGPVMNRLVRKNARAAMGAAFRHGSPDDLHQAFELARDHLDPMRLAFYRVARFNPSLFRRVMLRQFRGRPGWASGAAPAMRSDAAV